MKKYKFKVDDRVEAVKDENWSWGNQDRDSKRTIVELKTGMFEYSVNWDANVGNFFYHEYNIRLVKPKFFQEELEV